MLKTVWEQFLTIIKDEYGSRVVETWFKSVIPSHWEHTNRVLYLQTPNPFVKDWIVRNYMAIIHTHMVRLFNVTSLTVEFIDTQEAKQESGSQSVPPTDAIASLLVKPASVAQSSPVISKRQTTTLISASPAMRNLSKLTYSFDSFVVGPHNSLAYAAAHAIADNPGTLYNPFFVYGGSGLGKTHLLHSIGTSIKEKNRSAVVVYQTTDRFVNEFISAIRFNKIHKFHLKYQYADALLIDDVQCISHKEQTQEAFFNIFNFLYEANKQIILSSDTLPQHIKGIADRLRSRLSWGLVTDIQKPSFETKIAIIKKKAELYHECLESSVAEFVANYDALSNIRTLEGALIKVIAFASLTKQPITLDLARKVLLQTDQESMAMKTVDFEMVLRCIHKHYQYTRDDLLSKSRHKELAFARHVAMFLMRKATNKSLRDIGAYLGGRDHSTVMHAIEKVEEHAQEHAAFKNQLSLMEQELLLHQ